MLESIKMLRQAMRQSENFVLIFQLLKFNRMYLITMFFETTKYVTFVLKILKNVITIFFKDVKV